MELKENLNAGDEITIQIAPFGEYPAMTVDGKEIVQRFTKDAFQNIIDDWKGKGSKMIRADFDHNSEMTDNTIASGWIRNLSIDDEKGLVGTLVVSESGADALNGLDYRFGSPVFIFDETEHPISLLSFAFTNRPRLKDMDAVWNAEEKIEEKTQETIKESPESPNISIDDAVEVNNDKESKQMEEIRIILGLPEEATEEDIKASIKELVEKVKSIADSEIAEEAEKIVNECGIDDDKKEEVINSYKQNPALVKTVLNCLKKAPSRMVVNADEATRPNLTDDEKLRKEFNSLPGGQKRVDFIMSHKGIKF